MEPIGPLQHIFWGRAPCSNAPKSNFQLGEWEKDRASEFNFNATSVIFPGNTTTASPDFSLNISHVHFSVVLILVSVAVMHHQTFRAGSTPGQCWPASARYRASTKCLVGWEDPRETTEPWHHALWRCLASCGTFYPLWWRHAEFGSVMSTTMTSYWRHWCHGMMLTMVMSHQV